MCIIHGCIYIHISTYVQHIYIHMKHLNMNIFSNAFYKHLKNKKCTILYTFILNLYIYTEYLYTFILFIYWIFLYIYTELIPMNLIRRLGWGSCNNCEIQNVDYTECTSWINPQKPNKSHLYPLEACLLFLQTAVSGVLGKVCLAWPPCDCSKTFQRCWAVSITWADGVAENLMHSKN